MTLFIPFLSIVNAMVMCVFVWKALQATRELENHWKTRPADYKDAGRERYHQVRAKIERERTRSSLICIVGSYPAGMVLSMITVCWTSELLRIGLMLMVSLGLVVISLRAMVHNDRSFEEWMRRQYPLSGE